MSEPLTAESFLVERPFGVQQIACAIAALRADMVKPNARGLYDFTLSDEQWDSLRADKSFGLMFFASAQPKYVRFRGTLDLIPLGASLHIGEPGEPTA